MRALSLICIFLVADANGKRRDKDGEGAERVRSEVTAAGSTVPTPDIAAKAVKAESELELELQDALKDIMAVLQHGSDASKDAAIEKLVQLAVHSSEAGRDQARLFRSAVVAGDTLQALVPLLGDGNTRRQHLAASAIHALAIDDPNTDEDNFHQLEICQSGAVPPLVRLLDSEDPGVQHAATGALSALAENPVCQGMIASENAVAPLLAMASYGPDMQKVGALGALDVLAINNGNVKQQLQEQGATELLSGISSMGSPLLREEASAFGARLAEGSTAKLDKAAHVKAARQTRVRYDGVRQRAFRMMQPWNEGST